MSSHTVLHLCRFANFVGTYGVESLRDFVNGVLLGRIATAPVLAPPLVKDASGTCTADGGLLLRP
jgi:hypothetical protein